MGALISPRPAATRSKPDSTSVARHTAHAAAAAGHSRRMQSDPRAGGSVGEGRGGERRAGEGDLRTQDRTPQSTHPHAHPRTNRQTSITTSVQRSILSRTPNPPVLSPEPNRVSETMKSTPAGSGPRELELLHERIMSPPVALREQALASARVEAKIGRENVSSWLHRCNHQTW